MEHNEKQNIVTKITQVFTTIVVILSVAIMIFTIVSVNLFDQNNRNILGYKAYIVMSNSMSKTHFDSGDLVLIKDVDPSTLREGDVISYVSQDYENYGETVTHKIRRLTTDLAGNPGFITYGTTTDTDDKLMVYYPYVLGKHVGTIPKVGIFFNFLKTPTGYFSCIFTPFILLLIFRIKDFFALLFQYRKEVKEEREMESEKAQEEIEVLKAKIAALEKNNK